MTIWPIILVLALEPLAAERFGAAREPAPIAPGVVSTRDGEHSPTLDVERGELIFMRRTPGLFDYTLYSSRWDGSTWTEPTALPFSGDGRDAGSYLDPTGETLYFDSRRPVDGLARNSINIWRAERAADGWADPVLVEGPSRNPATANAAAVDEFGPAVDGAGTLYVYSFRAPYRAGTRVVSQGPEFTGATPDASIPDPSQPTFVSYLYVSPDGRTAIMEGRGAEGAGSDLYYSCRCDDGTWTAAEPLPRASGPGYEGGPWMTPDGSMLLFSREVEGQETGPDLYLMSTEGLPIPCP